MKKLYTLLVLLFAISIANSQIVNIPDVNFKARLLSASPSNTIASTQPLVYNPVTGIYSVSSYNKIDTNNDGQIQVSEAQAIKYLKLTNYAISNLTGVESFINLEYLRCDNNALTTSLDLSQHTALKYFDGRDNYLTSINISQNTALEYLDCSGNDLISLNVSLNTGLKFLYCGNNPLTTLNVSQNISLKTLSCGGTNQLTTLDVSQNIALENLSCTNYELTSLDVSQNLALKYLNCNYNQLSSLDVSQNLALKTLYCDYNQLSSLDLSQNTALEFLTCINNQLTSLNVSQNPALQELYCNFNQLTSLNLEHTALTNLNCNYNQLTSMFLKNGNAPWSSSSFGGNPTLTYICTDDQDINTFKSSVNIYGYTNCEVNSYCSFTPGGTFYTVQGNSKIDFDNNTCDINDLDYPNLKISISDGTNSGTFIANSTGHYSVPLNAGNFILTPIIENSDYFTILPTNLNVSFPSSTSPLIQNFCLLANGVRNDLEVVIIPINEARPGFDLKYIIVFKNKGNQVANGILNFSFDDSVMDLVTTVPNADGSAVNSLTWNFSNFNPFETREIEITFNLNSPTETPAVNGGDILNYTATITGASDETPNDNSSTLNQTVVNSFDPNDKTCIEGTSITPSMVGQYVHYVIRFENTGSANAVNIVVKDMIDTAKFDIASLVPQSSSHPFVTRISSTNKVEFIFENINLPFDNANNDGYVAFKIKTKPTLVAGNTFSNGANIYFDYNFPITTNTYVTTVQALGNQDFEFNSVFSLSPVPTKDILTITTKQTVEISSVNIYNTLGQLVQVNTNPSETIDVSGLQSGSYFIKIISDKGSAAGKFVKE